MTNNKFAVRTAAVTFFISTIAASGTAFGQVADADDGGYIEEIVVTAQKREKTLLETPVAISAFSGDTLEQSSVRDIRDLQTLVPAFNLTQSQTSFQTVVNIRGLGTSGQNPGLEPSVGIYVDGVFRSRTGAATGDFLSLERIEVLRGPQSTLFGKNTSAGVISIITQKPQYEFGGKAEVSYGNYDQVIVKGTVTGPLIADRVALRLSANYNKRDGFLTNLLDGKDINNRDRFSVRGQLLADPSDNIQVRIIVDYAETDERCCSATTFVNGPVANVFAGFLGLPFTGELDGSGDPFARELYANTDIGGTSDDFGVSGQIDYDFGGATLTSITAYRSFESDQDFDGDFSAADLIGATGSLIKVDTFTQELRLTSNGSHTIDWLVGGFYFNQDLSADDKVLFGVHTRPVFDILSLGGLDTAEFLVGTFIDPTVTPGTFFAPGTGQVRELFTNDAESWALFGQFDWHISDKVTLTGGLRFTKEDKHGTGTFVNNDAFSALTAADFVTMSLIASGGLATTLFDGLKAFQFLLPNADFDRNRSEDKFTGNAILSYDASDDVSGYISFSRGYKAGGFDVSRGASSLDGSGGTFEFDPETVDNFELGLKTRVMEGRGRINVALYRQKVKDFQSNLFTGTGFELRNAGVIVLKGVEVDAAFSFTDNFSMTMAFALNNAIYASFLSAACPIADPAASCDLTGEVVSDSPKWTVANTATYNRPISDNMSVFLRGETYYRGARFTDSDNDPNNFQGATFQVNASFGLQGADNGWQVVFWGKNLTKENYAQIIFDASIQPGTFAGYPNDPRTYGVTVRGSF